MCKQLKKIVTMQHLFWLTLFILLLATGIIAVPTNTTRTLNVARTLQSYPDFEKWWEEVSTSYPSYKDTTHILYELKEAHPHIMNFYSVGTSVEGREMWVINLREFVQEPRKLLQPPMKIVANMHGDEVVGRALVLMLAIDLMKRFTENDPRVVQLLSYTDIHLMPSVNPDGFEHARYSGCPPQEPNPSRENSHSVDLNRNFPRQFASKPKKNSTMWVGREPETINMMKYIISNDFVLSANLHGGFLVASYPFDSVPLYVLKRLDYEEHGVPSLSPDNDVFVYLAKLYASNHKTMTDTSAQCHGVVFPDGITNGADWYNVRGGMQDFNYVHSNTFEITMELSCCKYPPASTLLNEWANNQEALYKYMEATHMGIRGFVIDSQGNPVEGVEIIVEGINHTVRSTKQGEYWRLLLPGEYKVRASAVGYETAELMTVDGDFNFQMAGRAIFNFTILTLSEASTLNSTSGSKSTSSNSSIVPTNSSKTPPTKPSKIPTKSTSTGGTGNKTSNENNSTTDGSSKLKPPSGSAKPNRFGKPSPAEEVEAFFIQMSRMYPHITWLHYLGRNLKNEPLYVLEISNNPGMLEPDKPAYRYGGSELLNRKYLMALTRYLLENYERRAEITLLINSAHIFMVPFIIQYYTELSATDQYNQFFPQVNGRNTRQSPVIKSENRKIQNYLARLPNLLDKFHLPKFAFNG